MRGTFPRAKTTQTGTTRPLYLSKSVNGMGSKPNVNSQHNESKDDKGIELLVANVMRLVEKRVARSARDAKGSRPDMQPCKQDLPRSKHFARSKHWNTEQET